MTGGNVTNIQPNLIPNGQIKSKDEVAATGFVDVMNKTVNTQSNVGKDAVRDNTVSNTDKTSANKAENVNDNKTNKVEAKTDSKEVKSDDNKAVDAKDAKEVKPTEDAAQETEVEEVVVEESDEVLEAVVVLPEVEVVTQALDQFEEKVQTILSDNLDISEDKLNDAMEVLNLTVADMLNPKDVTQLMVEVTDVTESISLVLDEDISNALTAINEAAGQVLEQTNLEPKTIQQVAEQNSAFGEVLQEMDVVETPVELEAQVQPEVVEANVEVSDSDEVVVTNNVAANVEDMVDVPEENVEVEGEANVEVVDNTNKKVSQNVEATNVDNAEEEVTPVKVETNANEGFKQENTFGQATNTVLNQELQQVTDVNEIPEVQEQPQLSRYQAVEVVNQLTEQARVTINNEVTDLEMILNPESLGKIYLHVSEKQGALKAQIATQNEVVKEALENQMALLKDNLNRSGVKVESVEVSVGTHEFEKNLEEGMQQQEQQGEREEANQQNRKMRNIDMNNLDELQGLMSDEERLVAQMMKDQGNTFNYTA